MQLRDALPPVQARAASLLSSWGCAGEALVRAYVRVADEPERTGFAQDLQAHLLRVEPTLSPSGHPERLQVGTRSPIEVGARVGSGTYGTVYSALQSQQRGVWKRMVAPSEGALGDRFAFEVASELLAHAVVSTDPELGHSVPALWGAGWYTTPTGQVEFLCLMEDLGAVTLLSELQAVAARDGRVPWASLRQPLLDVASLLQPLLGRYSFNHRDLTLANVMRRPGTGALCLIDMGFACLLMDGVVVRGGNYYAPRSTCGSVFQDMALLLLNVREYARPDRRARAILGALLRTSSGEDLGVVASAHWHSSHSSRSSTADQPPTIHMSYNTRSDMFAPLGPVLVPGANVGAYPQVLWDAEKRVEVTPPGRKRTPKRKRTPATPPVEGGGRARSSGRSRRRPTTRGRR